MIRYVGLDVHKRVVEAVIIDKQGRILHRSRFGCSRAELQLFGKQQLQRTDRVALEATTNTWGVVRVLKPFVKEVVVSNPLRTKAIATAKVKTDKVDALVLAQLLRCDFLPRVWEPPEELQQLRSLTSRRASLVADRTAIKNRIHAVLHQRLLIPPTKTLFTTAGLDWLAALELDEAGKSAIASDLRLLDKIDEELDALDMALARRGYDDSETKLLMTMPGIDIAVAQTLVAALGDIKRFRDANHAASYLGLVPSTKQSADHCYHGPITKQGNSHARWMLVQAAQHVASHPGPLGAFFRRLAKKKNRNVAVVAVARKLVVIAWHMLTKKEPYRYALPGPTQAKLARLRVRGSGQRRQGGTSKGAPRPAAYGTGEGTRAVPSINQVYQAEGLPYSQAFPPGEVKMIGKQNLRRFVAHINNPRRKPRKMARNVPMEGSAPDVQTVKGGGSEAGRDAETSASGSGARGRP